MFINPLATPGNTVLQKMESTSPSVLAFSFVLYLITITSKALAFTLAFGFVGLYIVWRCNQLNLDNDISSINDNSSEIHDINGVPVSGHQWRSRQRNHVFFLLSQYANRGVTVHCCTATIIRQLFETNPQGLTQVNENGCTPLHAILSGSTECEADLFKSMAEQCPRNMLTRSRFGCIPLHRACRSLTRYLGDDSSEICKYLIEQNPESVRIPVFRGHLLIHLLLRHRQHRPVKEVIVSLLRAHPESYNMGAYDSVLPSSIPFIQSIKPLLDEERELKENVADLQEMSGVFQDAVDSPLASSTYIVFDSWAKSLAQSLEARMEQISTELQDECNVEEEGDREREFHEFVELFG